MKSGLNASNKVRSTTHLEIEEIIASGKVSRQTHLLLTTTLLSDQSLDDRDRLQINRVLEYVQLGKLELVD